MACFEFGVVIMEDVISEVRRFGFTRNPAKSGRVTGSCSKRADKIAETQCSVFHGPTLPTATYDKSLLLGVQEIWQMNERTLLQENLKNFAISYILLFQELIWRVEMAETVVSMAMSMVGSAISMASSAASQEMSMLIGVQNEIWFIKDELRTMKAFLRAAEVRKERDELVKVWAEQVRDLAYDIEDCLQEFAVHVGRQSLSRQLMKLRHRHKIAVQIRSLKLRVEEVSKRNMRYNLIKSVPSSGTDDSQSNMEFARYQAAHYVDEAELVGFDGPTMISCVMS
ncbi:hypothetical protein E2562_034507 [Oryza meyeriana var. granulata]|uniref:Disease resistance N-terminal domain-containing protein n=1 Tax=Oryza meyeriana var. granulata TaxID=110450 RepID=A0A6G1CWF3_9ORYZ|nr:hypothetical protein E2562_034507 [Oryza meyeriana var. granulata]